MLFHGDSNGIGGGDNPYAMSVVKEAHEEKRP
jgi:hypothetical protein